MPVVRLTEIFRQAAESGIVRNAHRINRGELPAFARAEDGPGDCYGIRVTGPEDAAGQAARPGARTASPSGSASTRSTTSRC